MIHLNHAGTSWPKPPEVAAAVVETLTRPPGDAGEVLERGRVAVGRLIGVRETDRIAFTQGCTPAIALVLSLLPWERGDVVLTSGHEHHALAGPLETLVRLAGIEWIAVPPGGGEAIDVERVEELLARGRVRLLATTFASNVTGAFLPLRRLSALAQRHGARFLLDAAQAAGNVPLDVESIGADAVVIAGHKGPLGPLGVGALWTAPRLDLNVPAATCTLPAEGAPPASPACGDAPGFCDVGSANLPAIAGLTAGIEHLEARGIEAVRAHAISLTRRLLDGLATLDGVRVVGPDDAESRLGVVSILPPQESPSDAERRLLTRHRITVRAGHHCAPLAHQTLGTTAGGTLRISVGPANTTNDVDALVAALADVRDPPAVA